MQQALLAARPPDHGGDDEDGDARDREGRLPRRLRGHARGDLVQALLDGPVRRQAAASAVSMNSGMTVARKRKPEKLSPPM